MLMKVISKPVIFLMNAFCYVQCILKAEENYVKPLPLSRVHSPTPGLLYDRMNKEVVFILSLILMGASYAPAPFGRSLYGYSICLTLAATGVGMSESGKLIYFVEALLMSVFVVLTVFK